MRVDLILAMLNLLTDLPPMRPFDNDSFAKHAALVYGGFYYYGLVQYMGMNTPIDIVCPKHGGFKQTPSEHLVGLGCPRCQG
jgi:hypothetical protein